MGIWGQLAYPAKKYIDRLVVKAIGRLSQFASDYVQLHFDIYNLQFKVTSNKLFSLMIYDIGDDSSIIVKMTRTVIQII